MQRAITHLLTKPFISATAKHSQAHRSKTLLLTGTMLALSVTLSGCQTIKNITGGDDGALTTASQTDAGYYAEAMEALDKGHYLDANELLTELRTFYPTGRYAEQALLDLMYSQFNTKDYELAANNAELFISLYPNSQQVDYAYYVRGVANMQTGTNTLLNVAKQNLAHRDNSYMRLAFNNFQELLNRFPTSPYVPDAAQRMNFIYNQFAESEMAAARWYVKREAYVAAANRAKWVFQYYPLSEQTPEAIAILAYSHEQLGTHDLAQEYKTLLQINYPEWLTSNGDVRLEGMASRSFLNMISFGTLGRSSTLQSEGEFVPYTGETKTQVIRRAAELQLAQEQSPMLPNTPNTGINTPRRTINVGLGIPEADSEQIGSQSSSSQTASNSVVKPDNVNPTRRTTLPVRRDTATRTLPSTNPNINNAPVNSNIDTNPSIPSGDDVNNENEDGEANIENNSSQSNVSP